MRKSSLITGKNEKLKKKKILAGDFPGGPVAKNLPSNAGDPGSIPGLRSHMLRGS